MNRWSWQENAHVQIDPLEDAAIEMFLGRWCEALFADSPAGAKPHLAELLEALRSRREIRRMARNPVMLTALAVLHWNDKRLPEQRADLYESIITWLARARMRTGRLSPERCVDLLQNLALAMQDHPDGRQTQVPRRCDFGISRFRSTWPRGPWRRVRRTNSGKCCWHSRSCTRPNGRRSCCCWPASSTTTERRAWTA